jgi:hypothetical protein
MSESFESESVISDFILVIMNNCKISCNSNRVNYSFIKKKRYPSVCVDYVQLQRWISNMNQLSQNVRTFIRTVQVQVQSTYRTLFIDFAYNRLNLHSSSLKVRVG